MRPMPVYAAEREAGLADLIRSSGRVAYASVAELSEPFVVSAKARAKMLRAQAASGEQQDLYYLRTLLATAGTWNKNFDVFDRVETWNARHSAEDKPFNFEHVADDIIGHITASHAVDEAGSHLAEDTVIDDLPAKFHVVTSAVLYRFLGEQVLQERMDKIIAEIAEGKWYVSMEALSAFDYALRDAGGVQKIVARCESTAFLTKHLKAYGGDGTYQDWEVGRFMRGLFFSGKGLVKKPANPESIIFADNSEPFAAAATEFHVPKRNVGYGIATGSREQTPKESEHTMTPEAIQALQAELAAAKANVADLTKQLQERGVQELTAKAAALEADLKTAREPLASHAEQAKAWATEKADLTCKATAAETARAEAVAKLAEIAAAQKRSERITALAQAFEVEQAKAESLVEVYGDLPDDKFAAILKAQADYLAAKKAEYQAATNAAQSTTETAKPVGPTTPTGGAKAPPQATSKPAPMAGQPKKVGTIDLPVTGNQATKASETNPEDDPAEVNAQAQVLDHATPTAPQVALAVENAGPGVEKVRASIADFVSGYLNLEAAAEANA